MLKADRFVPYGVVIDIMDTVKWAGFKRIIAPTIMEEESGK